MTLFGNMKKETVFFAPDTGVQSGALQEPVAPQEPTQPKKPQMQKLTTHPISTVVSAVGFFLFLLGLILIFSLEEGSSIAAMLPGVGLIVTVIACILSGGGFVVFLIRLAKLPKAKQEYVAAEKQYETDMQTYQSDLDKYQRDFDKYEKDLEAYQREVAKNDFNPKGKPLNWFFSETGIKSCQKHLTAQNYLLEDQYTKDFEAKRPDDYKYDGVSFALFLKVYHDVKNAMLPCLYFEALAEALDVQPLGIKGIFETFIDVMKIAAQPFHINEEGEPEASEPLMSPERLISLKNPLLYFLKNFSVFEIKEDELGSKDDKYAIYSDVVFFLAQHIDQLKTEEMQWLFKKEIYLNDVGTVRKEKNFLKLCKEISKYPEYFEELISQLN